MIGILTHKPISSHHGGGEVGVGSSGGGDVGVGGSGGTTVGGGEVGGGGCVDVGGGGWVGRVVGWITTDVRVAGMDVTICVGLLLPSLVAVGVLCPGGNTVDALVDTEVGDRVAVTV